MVFLKMITINDTIETILISIYSNDLLSGSLFLKGGQALRFKEKLTNRFSADADFSTPSKIDNVDIFFEALHTSLSTTFLEKGYYLFAFKYTKRPKKLKDGSPDFWSGWGVEFKIIEEQKRNLPLDVINREALIPEGASSPRITLDISEYEYCGSVEKIKISHDIEVNSYSRALLLLEKIRAICQQHPKYPHKNSDQRARDYYDVERLWNKALQESENQSFIDELKKHVNPVFKAKDVDLDLIHKIFETEFIEIQRTGWPQVESTVKGKIQDFDYYVQTLRGIVNLIVPFSSQ